MSRQRGSIKEIIKGKKYKISFYIGLDVNGKRKYHIETIEAKNKAEAQKYLSKKLVEFDTGKLPLDESNIIVRDYLDKWLKTKNFSLALSTYNNYKKIINIYINPYIGSYKLSKITPLLIQDMYTKLVDKGLSARVVRYTHQVLSEALDQAIIWQIINRNPCKGLSLPKSTKKEMKALTVEQAKIFLNACIYNKWGILFELLIISGMRPSEALALKWNDINWKDNRITIQRSLTRVNNLWAFKEPKTSNGRRTITMPSEVMNNLKEYKNRQDIEKSKSKEIINYDEAKEKMKPDELQKKLDNPKIYIDYGLVFATSNGNPLDLANINYKYFKPLLKEAGLPNIRLYDLRHTCATLLMMSKENPKIVSERLGHSSIGITLDTYSHVLPDMQEEAASKLKNLLLS